MGSFQEDTERTQIHVLAVQAITSLVLSAMTVPVAGNPAVSCLEQQPRNKPLKALETRSARAAVCPGPACVRGQRGGPRGVLLPPPWGQQLPALAFVAGTEKQSAVHVAARGACAKVTEQPPWTRPAVVGPLASKAGACRPQLAAGSAGVAGGVWCCGGLSFRQRWGGPGVAHVYNVKGMEV